MKPGGSSASGSSGSNPSGELRNLSVERAESSLRRGVDLWGEGMGAGKKAGKKRGEEGKGRKRGSGSYTQTVFEP